MFHEGVQLVGDGVWVVCDMNIRTKNFTEITSEKRLTCNVVI